MLENYGNGCLINESELMEDLEFAKNAAKKFSKESELTTFTIDDIKEGEKFAVRWGLGSDCVLVFTIGDTPRIYSQLITKEQK